MAVETQVVDAEQLIVQHLDLWTSAQTAKSTAGRGSNNKIELTGIKKLRELILELAVRGKLVPQDPNDEPASELLKRIALENEALFKAGKLKKQKSILSIPNEDKPFDLPKGWEWVTLSSCTELENGDRSKNYPNKDTLVETGVPFVNAGHLVKGEVDATQMTFITEQHFELLRSGKFQAGDILFCLRGSLGKSAIVKNLTKGAIASSLVIVRTGGVVLPEYLMNYFDSLLCLSMIKKYDNGTAQPNLSAADLAKFKIPLPSLAEQKRIEAKVNELMALCDQLEQQSYQSIDAHNQLVDTLLQTLVDSANADELASNWQRISEHFDTLFTTEYSIDALKQTILQLAVMGKLVKQDPTDEPASELLKRIAKEKEALVKAGKIKKQKPLPPITDDEKPFELPDGWAYATLQQLVTVLGDGLHGTPVYDSQGGYYFVNGNNLKDGSVIIKSETKKVNEVEYQKFKKELNERTVFVSINGTLGNVAFYNNEPIVLGKSACYFNLVSNFSKNFIKLIIQTPYFSAYASTKATGSTIRNLGLAAMNCLPIPVPPLSEQDRIVAKVDKLTTIFDSIICKLKEAKQTQTALSEVFVEQVV